MSTYRCTFNTHIEVVVEVHSYDEEGAADAAWEVAEEFLQGLGTEKIDHRIKWVDASLDGIGADDVEAVES